MTEVYEFAVCNLSASAFSFGSQGMLVPVRVQNPMPPRVHLSAASDTYYVVDREVEMNMWEGQLFQKAWILQEQILARRTLHFTRDQVSWECKQLLATEVSPRGHTAQLRISPPLKYPQYRYWQFNLNKIA
ncbi:hypothetical protein E8E11_011625 [Didymella keratinophila]|nr:hypothetical protein E8E11_011625 [Didymella keratinophila]